MKTKEQEWQKHEQGTLVALVLFSIAGLIYISSNFFFNIVFAAIMTLSTYPLYNKIKELTGYSSGRSAGITTISVGVLLVAPVSYIISILGIESLSIYKSAQNLFSKIDFTTKETAVNSLMSLINLSEKYTSTIKDILLNHIDIQNILQSSKTVLLFLSQNAIGSVFGTIGFFVVSLFVMYFLYKDGEKIVEKIKQISPLHDDYDTILMREISRLSGILTLSILSVAFIQGLSFAVATFFLDLNWLFLGIAVALTSFIPVVGTMLVWFPLGLYLFLTGHTYQGVFIMAFGALFIGVVVDNILRPVIISYISKIFDNAEITTEEKKNFNPLDHTLIVTMSTLGGIIKFGIVGLFLGPIIAGIAIAVLEIYRLRLSSTETKNETQKAEVAVEQQNEIIPSEDKT